MVSEKDLTTASIRIALVVRVLKNMSVFKYMQEINTGLHSHINYALFTITGKEWVEEALHIQQAPIAACAELLTEGVERNMEWFYLDTIPDTTVVWQFDTDIIDDTFQYFSISVFQYSVLVAVHHSRLQSIPREHLRLRATLLEPYQQRLLMIQQVLVLQTLWMVPGLQTSDFIATP